MRWLLALMMLLGAALWAVPAEAHVHHRAAAGPSVAAHTRHAPVGGKTITAKVAPKKHHCADDCDCQGHCPGGCADGCHLPAIAMPATPAVAVAPRPRVAWPIAGSARLAATRTTLPAAPPNPA